MSDLASRPNPSAWAELLRLALPILDEASGRVGRFDWSLGGGTAIALRISHRISDDIDIFVEQADLRALSPYLPFKNAAASALNASVQFPGNYLKLQLAAGEIDFLPGPMLSAPGFSAETFEGRPIALQTCEEVILRKIRYRAAGFKARDVFDFAAVIRTCDDVSEILLDHAADRLPTLLTAVRRHDTTSLGKANIRVMPGYEALLSTAIRDVERFLEKLMERGETDA